jgi:hypothetical protein
MCCHFLLHFYPYFPPRISIYALEIAKPNPEPSGKAWCAFSLSECQNDFCCDFEIPIPESLKKILDSLLSFTAKLIVPKLG